VGNNSDVSTPGCVNYGNVSFGDIIMHAINFHVYLTTVVLEYNNGYFWQCKFKKIIKNTHKLHKHLSLRLEHSKRYIAF
jgi:hypothetical protein